MGAASLIGLVVGLLPQSALWKFVFTLLKFLIDQIPEIQKREVAYRAMQTLERRAVEANMLRTAMYADPSAHAKLRVRGKDEPGDDV